MPDVETKLDSDVEQSGVIRTAFRDYDTIG